MDGKTVHKEQFFNINATSLRYRQEGLKKIHGILCIFCNGNLKKNNEITRQGVSYVENIQLFQDGIVSIIKISQQVCLAYITYEIAAKTPSL